MKADARLSPTPQPNPLTEQAARTLIPNLCQIQSVLLILILTQLFAIVVSVARGGDHLISWEHLGLLSVYSHAIVLSCSGVICLSRHHLSDTAPRHTGLIALLIIVGVTYLISQLAALWLSPHFVGDASLFVWRSVLISSILGILLMRYFYLQFQWREQKQAELRSRLEALQSRIRPHFLFNSMNTIASLITVDPDRAEEAVLDLSALFRATLQTQAMLISLRDELSLCRRYLNIEALRLGKRLTLDWSIAPQLDTCLIPPLTLQPLLENAIYHGIQPLTEGGTIRIECYRRKNTVYVLISNPYDPDAVRQPGNQIALDNIRHRFLALFGEAAVLKTSQQDRQYTVTLRFPARTDAPNDDASGVHLNHG